MEQDYIIATLINLQKLHSIPMGYWFRWNRLETHFNHSHQSCPKYCGVQAYCFKLVEVCYATKIAITYRFVDYFYLSATEALFLRLQDSAFATRTPRHSFISMPSVLFWLVFIALIRIFAFACSPGAKMGSN